MKIVMFDGHVIECRKIEPSIKLGYLVIDEDYSIALVDIVCITEDD